MCICIIVNINIALLVAQNLLRGEQLKLVDGGQSQRTFVYIKDAIEVVLLMIVRQVLSPSVSLILVIYPYYVEPCCIPNILLGHHLHNENFVL